MKRIFKICTVAGAILFIVGMGLSAFGARSGESGRLGGGETALSGQALESAADANSLDIRWADLPLYPLRYKRRRLHPARYDEQKYVGLPLVEEGVRRGSESENHRPGGENV